jgi:hypothetical protein
MIIKIAIGYMHIMGYANNTTEHYPRIHKSESEGVEVAQRAVSYACGNLFALLASCCHDYGGDDDGVHHATTENASAETEISKSMSFDHHYVAPFR